MDWLTRPRGARRALLLPLVGALAFAFATIFSTVRPAFACSCAMRETIAQQATPDNAIFTGTAGLAVARGVPVQVDRWMWGRGAAPQVWLAADSFGDGAACGTSVPPAGSRWLWVTWIGPGSVDFRTGLCSPAGDLATPEGQAMLADALAVFDAVAPPEPVPEPTANAVAPTADAIAEARDRTAASILGALLVGAAAMFGGAVLLARRTRGRSS
jgi:hypothetical protein